MEYNEFIWNIEKAVIVDVSHETNCLKFNTFFTGYICNDLVILFKPNQFISDIKFIEVRWIFIRYVVEYYYRSYTIEIQTNPKR